MNHFKVVRYLITAVLSLGCSAWAMLGTPISPADCNSWKYSYVEPRMDFLLTKYASQMANFSPTDPIYQAMADHVSTFEDFIDDLDTMPCPEVLVPRESDLDADDDLYLDPNLDVLTIMTHGSVEYLASLPAQDGMESFLQFMMAGTQRLGEFAFITEGDILAANKTWMTLRRDPDYHIGSSSNGTHKIHFYGSEAFVGGGHLGQCQLVASEALVNNHGGSNLTVHWPMRAIFVAKETIDSVQLQGLTLYDIYLHYQSNPSAFLDRIEDYLHGEQTFGILDVPARVLSRTHTPYRIKLQINGVTQRSYGNWFGKHVKINLTQ